MIHYCKLRRGVILFLKEVTNAFYTNCYATLTALIGLDEFQTTTKFSEKYCGRSESKHNHNNVGSNNEYCSSLLVIS